VLGRLPRKGSGRRAYPGTPKNMNASILARPRAREAGVCRRCASGGVTLVGASSTMADAPLSMHHLECVPRAFHRFHDAPVHRRKPRYSAMNSTEFGCPSSISMASASFEGAGTSSILRVLGLYQYTGAPLCGVSGKVLPSRRQVSRAITPKVGGRCPCSRGPREQQRIVLRGGPGHEGTGGEERIEGLIK
jgi:hypothetical protein